MALTFLKEIQKELGKHEPEDVDRLVLDGLFEKLRILSEDHKKSFEKYIYLKHLSLSSVGLSCLKNFPELPTLKVLELRDNLLTGDDFEIITKNCPNLLKLKLGGNPIKNIECFNSFNKSDLIILDVYDTPLSCQKQYRETLFHKIRALEIVDAQDREGYTVATDLSDNEESEYEEDEEIEENSANSKSEVNSEDKDEFESNDDDKRNNKSNKKESKLNSNSKNSAKKSNQFKNEYDFEEEEEDDDYTANEDCEDEFDSDFEDEDDNLELSEYEIDDTGCPVLKDKSKSKSREQKTRK